MNKTIGNKIKYLDSVDSTNNYLKALYADHKPDEGLLIFTKTQLSGRGQQENNWESETNKNLLFSFIIYPTFLKADAQFILSKVISLAIVDFISQHVSNVHIKWPNDIYVGNKKIAGVLIENTIKGSKISSSIIGIGININQENFSDNTPNAVSLTMLTKKTYNINEHLQSLISNLNVWYNTLLLGHTAEINNLYLNSLFRYNQTHNYVVAGKKIKGKIIGIDPNGRLIIEIQNEGVRVFAFKEIEYCFENSN